jgi:exopolysaccharide biosynthesis polyprenyl glycosylphosphotransferase
MGIAPDYTNLRTVRPIRIHSRALLALPLTALFLDIVLIACVVTAAAIGRDRLLTSPAPQLSTTITAVGVPVAIGWVLLIALRGGYSQGVFGAGADEYKAIVSASLITAGCVGITSYLLKFQLSRGFFVLTFVIGLPVLALGRYVLRSSLHRARAHGSLGLRTLIVGSSDHIDAVASVLAREPWLGYHMAGALTPPNDTREETPGGIPVIGNVDDAPAMVREYEAEVVFVVGGAFSHPSKMRALVWDLEPENVQVILAPGVTDVSSERIRVRPVAGLALLHLDGPRSAEALRWAKRTFDVVGSSFLLMLLSPLFLWTALKIRSHDHGPILFRQTRVGRDGQFFTCLKFRSMVVNAEQVLADLHNEVGYSEGLFKLRDDPRITKPGAWIRRYSIDELPQLINVLRGDMSLVGPRPPLPLEVDRYTDVQSRRLRVRPGMTGLWQVSGRSDLSWSESIRLDLYYVDNWSMIQDIIILVRTVGAVLGSRGAY